MAEYDDVTIRYHAVGLDTLSKAGNLITGINQGLELMQRALDVASRATAQFISTGSMFERYNLQFETLLKSSTMAKQRMEELADFAANTPFDLPGVVDAAKTLEAYGLYSERALRAAGDAAAAFGKDFNETALAVAAAATGELERLKMYGITSARLAAEMGHEVRRETVADLREIAETVVEIFEKDAAGGMLKLSTSLSGMVSNLGDSWIRFKKEVADSGPFEAVKVIIGSILTEVNRLFESGQAEQLASSIGSALSDALYGATLAILEAARVIAGVGNFFGKVAVGPAAGVAQSAGIPTAFGAMGSGLKALYGSMFGSFVDVSREDSATIQSIDKIIASINYGRYSTFGPFPEDVPAQSRVGSSAPAAGGHMRYPSSESGYAVTYPATGQGGFYGYDLGGFAGPELDPEDAERRQRDVNEKRVDENEKLTSRMMGQWERYYTSISKYSAKWAQGEGKVLKDVWRATREMLAGILSDVIQEKAREAAVKKAMALADMLLHQSSFNWGAAAKAAAAAVGYAAIGAVGSGLVEGFLAGPEPDTDVGESLGASQSDNGRAVSRSTAGIKAQSITYNLYVIHNATAVYGSTDGIRELFETQFLPLLEERGVAFA